MILRGRPKRPLWPYEMILAVLIFALVLVSCGQSTPLIEEIELPANLARPCPPRPVFTPEGFAEQVVELVSLYEQCAGKVDALHELF